MGVEGTELDMLTLAGSSFCRHMRKWGQAPLYEGGLATCSQEEGGDSCAQMRTRRLCKAEDGNSWICAISTSVADETTPPL